MSRNCFKIHGHMIRLLVFVIILVTIVLIGSSLNNERRKNDFHPLRLLHRKNRISIIEHRTNGENEELETFDENYVDENDESPSEMIFEQFKESSHCHKILNDLDDSTLQKNEKNFTSCVDILIERYPEICDIIMEINNVGKLVRKIRLAIEERIAAKRLDFTLPQPKSKNTIEQMYVAIRYFAKSLKKLFQFFGTLEKYFTLDMTISILYDIIRNERFNRSFPRTKWSDTSPSHENPVEWLNIDKHKIYVEQDRRIDIDENCKIELINCVAGIVSSNMDCRTIVIKIDELDRFLCGEKKSRLEQESSEDSDYFLTKIDSKNITFHGILEAICESLLNPKKFDSSYYENESKDSWSSKKITSSEERRDLRNDNSENSAEIFEKSDFRIDFTSPNERESFSEKSWQWNSKDLTNRIHEHFQEYVTRPIYSGVDYRTFDFDGVNKKVPKKSFIADEKSRIILNSCTGTTDFLQHHLNNARLQDYDNRKMFKPFEECRDRDDSWLGPFYAADIIATKNLANSLDIDSPNDEFGQVEITTINMEKENDGWREMIYGKLGDFTNQFF